MSKSFRELVESALLEQQLDEGKLAQIKNRVSDIANRTSKIVGRQLTKKRFLTGFSTKSSSDHLDAATDELNQHELTRSGQKRSELSSVIVRHPKATAKHLNAAFHNGELDNEGIKAYLNHPNTTANDVASHRYISGKGGNDRKEHNLTIATHPKTSISQKIDALHSLRGEIPHEEHNRIANKIMEHPDIQASHLSDILRVHSATRLQGSTYHTASDVAANAIKHPKADSGVKSLAINAYHHNPTHSGLEDAVNKHGGYDGQSAIALSSSNTKLLDNIAEKGTLSQKIKLAYNKNANENHLHSAVDAHINDKSRLGHSRVTDENTILNHPNLNDEHKIKLVTRDNVNGGGGGYWAARHMLEQRHTSPNVLRHIYNNHSMLRDMATKHPNGTGLRNFGLPS